MVTLNLTRFVGMGLGLSLFLWAGVFKTIVYGHAFRPWAYTLIGLALVGAVVLGALLIGVIPPEHSEYIIGFSLSLWFLIAVDNIGQYLTENPDYAPIEIMVLLATTITTGTLLMMYFERQVWSSMKKRKQLEGSV